MSDRQNDHDNAPDPDVVRAAFDRLRTDSHEVDTMAALRELDDRKLPRWAAPGILGAAAAAVLIIVGLAVWRGGDDGPAPDQVAAGDPTAQPEVTPETEGGHDAATQPDPAAQTAWELVAGVGPEGDIPIVEGWPITLTLEGDRISGTAACNGYGGRLVTEGETVTVVDLGQEAALCGTDDGDIMESERLFLTALGLVDTVFRNEAELILTGPGTELIFNAVEGVPTAELVGRLWLLDARIDGETASEVLGDPATLLLRPDGTFEAGTGCRTFTGEYIVSGASVIFTSSQATGDCAADLREQDGFVITVLGDGFVPTIEFDRLTVTSQGKEGLRYLAVDEVPDFEPRPAVTLEELAGSSWTLAEGLGPAGEIVPGVGPLTLRFDENTVSGDAPCNRYGASYTLDGSSLTFGPIEGEQEGCDETDIERRFFDALAGVARIELYPGDATATGYMALIGPEVDLLFEELTPGGGSQGRTPLTVGEALDTRPSGPVTVIGNLWFRGGSWILCENLSDDPTPFCAGRWITLTNYDGVVDPHTEPPTGVNEAAVGLADSNESFRTDGSIVWTPETTAVTIVLTDDGRGVTPEFPDPTALLEEEIALLDAFVTAGSGVPFDRTSLRLADVVVIGLSDQLVETRTATELEDPNAWQLDLEAFRGWVGPFSALDLLAQAGDGRRAVMFGGGRHDHCASPPAPIAAGLEGARQLSIQPTGIDSCLQWWTVDVFVDAAGQVIGITLDLWEP